MKYLVLCCSILATALLFGKSGVVPPGDWTAEGYQYNMTYYAQVLRPDGTYIDHEQSVLAVFNAAGACRGAISPIKGPRGWLYQLGVSSDSVEEKGLAFKILDAVTGETYPIVETVDFATDAIVPADGIVNPIQLHVPENIMTIRLQPGWNLVAMEGEPLNPAELLELKPMVFDKANRSYILYSTDSTEVLLRRGTAVWLYNGDEKVRNMVIGLVAKSVEGASVAPEQEAWSLAGAVDDEPAWLEQVTRPFFRWDAEKGFVPAETPVKGQGYWAK